MRPEGESVDDRGGEARVGERLAPFAERCVRGDRDRRPLIPLGEDLEEQLGTPAIQMQVAQLVEAEKVDPSVAADHLGELAFVFRLDELVD